MQDELAKKVSVYVNKNDPLGPSDAARIKDDEVAAALFDPHNNAFNTLLRSDLSIVTGRRGSGKTALLRSYKYRRYLQDGSSTTTPYDFDLNDYEYVTEVTSHKQFEAMQERVAGAGDTLRPIESVEEDWSSTLRKYILVQLAASSTSNEQDQHLSLVRRYVEQNPQLIEAEVKDILGETLVEKLQRLFSMRGSDASISAVPIQMDTAWEAALKHLNDQRRRLVVIFDSMDEYEVNKPKVNRTVGALMRFMSSFNAENECIKIKLGLPIEVFPDIQRASANPLKDMVSFDQVRWTAAELARIAAFRYRLFLDIYDKPHAAIMGEFNLGLRRDVWEFWQRVFPEHITNRYGIDENPMTYVLRHTQLLPRQLFMILQSIIKESAKETGGYRRFAADAVIRSIESMEPVIAQEILGAFRYVYPFADRLGRAVFGNFPTVFTYDELEDRWRKRGRAIMREHDTSFAMVDFSEMLVRMCILGEVVKQTRYVEGRFAYHREPPFNIGEGQQLCLHPVFSRHFDAALNREGKAIRPVGSEVASDSASRAER